VTLRIGSRPSSSRIATRWEVTLCRPQWQIETLCYWREGIVESTGVVIRHLKSTNVHDRRAQRLECNRASQPPAPNSTRLSRSALVGARETIQFLHQENPYSLDTSPFVYARRGQSLEFRFHHYGLHDPLAGPPRSCRTGNLQSPRAATIVATGTQLLPNRCSDSATRLCNNQPGAARFLIC